MNPMLSNAPVILAVIAMGLTIAHIVKPAIPLWIGVLLLSIAVVVATIPK